MAAVERVLVKCFTAKCLSGRLEKSRDFSWGKNYAAERMPWCVPLVPDLLGRLRGGSRRSDKSSQRLESDSRPFHA